MGGLHNAGRTVERIGANLSHALEPAWGLLREAVRSKDRTIPTLTLYVHEDIGVGGYLKQELNRVDSLPARSRAFTSHRASLPAPRCWAHRTLPCRSRLTLGSSSSRAIPEPSDRSHRF